MTWPDFPPQAQLDAEAAGLSGSTQDVPDRDGTGEVSVPSEYAEFAGTDDFGFSVFELKAGYYYPDELAAWHAEQVEPEPDPGEPEVPVPTGPAAAVYAFLGAVPATAGEVEQVAAHVETARLMVRAYTRGGGFDGLDPREDVAAVIVSCAARMHGNPTNDRSQGLGPFQTSPGIFNGWTLPELAILHTYRARAK